MPVSKDPKKEAERRRKLSEAAKRQFADPEKRKKHQEATIKAMARKEVKDKMIKSFEHRNQSEVVKKQWKDDEVRRKHIDSSKKFHEENPDFMKEVANRPEVKKKIRKSLKKYAKTEQGKKNLSKAGKISMEKRTDNGIAFYNKRILGFFKWYDQLVLGNDNGIYAEHPKEEKCGRYWLDYVNHEKKIILEWDEKGHDNTNRYDPIKDKEREEFIKNKMEGYSFIRVKESDHPYAYGF